MSKDAAIASALQYLEQRLSKGSFQVMDHWDADRTVIGIASPSNTARLVYISYCNQENPAYYGFLEREPSLGAEIPFEHCGEFNGVNLDELVQVVSRHICSQG